MYNCEYMKYVMENGRNLVLQPYLCRFICCFSDFLIKPQRLHTRLNLEIKTVIEIDREDNVIERMAWENVTERTAWENVLQEKGPKMRVLSSLHFLHSHTVIGWGFGLFFPYRAGSSCTNVQR